MGPRIAHWFLPIPGKRDSNWRYSWVPVIGPAIGGIYGGLFYQALFEATPTLTFWIFSCFIIVLFGIALSKELKTAMM